MENPKAFLFEIIGTPEYILARAGLYRIRDYKIEPTEDLLRRLQGIPATPELQAALIQLVYFSNAEKGGAIDVARERRDAMEAMKNTGLVDTWGAISRLSVLIRKIVDEVAEERRNTPPFVCGTTWAE